MPPHRRLRPWVLSLSAVAVLILGSWLAVVLQRSARQREAVSALRAIGAVVTYDYQLDPSFRRARTHKEFMKACEKVTDRRDLPDPDHDGMAWFRRILGPDLFHDVIGVNMAYSYDAIGGGRAEPNRVFDDNLLLVSRFPKLRLLLLDGGQACDLVLEAIRELKHLEMIYMWSAAATDTGVENLRGLKKLRYLHLSNAGLTDRSLEVFGGLTELEGLSLQGNRFTDAGLIHLRDLTKLQSLWLCSKGGERGDSRIHGPGLAHLSALTNLEELAIQSTGFSDEGVPYLQPFAKLRQLYVHQSDLTPVGEARLRKILPNCKLDIQR